MKKATKRKQAAPKREPKETREPKARRSGSKYPTLPKKTTLANVASSASSVTLLAANAARLGAFIVNESTATLYVKCNSGTASATSYTKAMPTNTDWEVPCGYRGAITGIWASANGNARVTEFY